MSDRPGWAECPIRCGDVVEDHTGDRQTVRDVRLSGYPRGPINDPTAVQWVWEYRAYDDQKDGIRWWPFTRSCQVVIRSRIW